METLETRARWLDYIKEASGLIELDEGSAIVRGLITSVARIEDRGDKRFDSGSLRAEVMKGSKWIGLESSFKPFAISGFSQQIDHRIGSDAIIRERHFAIMIPARMLREDGSQETVLFAGLSRRPAQLGDHPFPWDAPQTYFRKMKVQGARSPKEALASPSRLVSKTATAACKEATKRWDLSELFSLARIEKEELDAALPSAPKKRALSM